MRVFFLLHFSIPLSLVYATSVGSVVMFLCSEWIHQHKNVLIIFIFYYTTRKPCQLGCRTLGREREKKTKGEEGKWERERQEWKLGGEMMQTTSKLKKQLSWTVRTLVNKRWRRHKILKQADQRSGQGDRTSCCSRWTLWHTENTNNTKLERNMRKERTHVIRTVNGTIFFYLFILGNVSDCYYCPSGRCVLVETLLDSALRRYFHPT